MVGERTVRANAERQEIKIPSSMISVLDDYGILLAWWETENLCRKKKSVASLKDIIVHLNLHIRLFKSHLRCCSFFLSWLISHTQFSKKELLFSKLCQRHPQTGCTATLLYVYKFLCPLCGLTLCCAFHLEIVNDAPMSLEGKLAKQHPLQWPKVRARKRCGQCELEPQNVMATPQHSSAQISWMQ